MLQVVMCGPFTSRSGYGDHARSIFYSLDTIEDFDIKIIDVRWGDTPQNALDSNIPKEKSIQDKITLPNEVTTQPDIYVDVRIPNEFMAIGKVNVGITAGIETTAVSAAFIQGANQMDLVIVPSEHSKKTFLDTTYDAADPQGNVIPGQQLKCTTQIEVVHEGLDPEIFYKIPRKEKDKQFENKINSIVKRPSFLFVGQWTHAGFGNDRKDIARTIKLFIETFANRPNPPGLILKTNGATYSRLDYVDIKKRIQQVKNMFPQDIKFPPIYLLHASMSEEDINKLYNHEKVLGLITLTHGEGFGRPMLEATFTELPVLATGYSGHLDFLPEDKCCLVKGELGKVPEEVVWENIIIPDSQWFTAEDLDVYDKFRSFQAENTSKWKRLGKELSVINREKFSMDSMTEKLVKIFGELKSKIAKPMKIKLPKLETI